MPRKGESYKHNMITDVIYKVDTVDKKNKTVYLRGGKDRALVAVSYDSLAANYQKV